MDPTQAPPSESRLTFEVSGLHCASCARSVEKAVGTLDGVDACSLDFSSARLRVEGGAALERILEQVERLGYQARPLAGEGVTGGEAPPEAPTSLLGYLLYQRETWPALFGALLLVPGLIFHEILHWHGLWIELPALLALLIAGGPVVQAAWRGIRVNREVNIQALITIAVAGALVIGAWVEAGMVVVLFALGEHLEGYATARARGAIRRLVSTAPQEATRVRRATDPEGAGKGEERVPVEVLVPGDVILVRPGERIPGDGRIVDGRSTVNQAALTGESVPLEKAVGSEVLAGSINGEGALEVQVTRPASETTLHRMIRMVEEARSERAPVERFIDRFARVYTPAIVVLAALVAIVPPLAFGAPFWNPDPDTFGWFYRSLALLVIACPCALVISVPASLVSAITNAAGSGVLIKGGAHMESLARVRAVAFDKTGTLTEGALTVVGVRSVSCAETDPDTGEPCEPCDELLALAAAVEERSEHPVGRAVTSAARDRLSSERIPVATGHQALTGRGITASLGGRPITIGSHRHLDLYLPREGPHRKNAEEAALQGRTPVVVEMDGRFLGTITLADIPRDSAPQAIRELADLGVSTTLISGDSKGAAHFLGERVGIGDIRAELLPEDKVQVIQELRERHGTVAMVGDGINDAPALATCDVGIAVGGALGGTDQAREAAAITLMGNDLRLLPRSIRLARAAMRTVRTNVAFAIGIKVVFLLLVLAGLGTMWMAVLADVGATLVVTLYGMRLLRWGRREGWSPSEEPMGVAPAVAGG